MIADTTQELLTMVNAIGVQRKYIQKAGTWKEHFDICLSKKQEAIALGAIEIDSHSLFQKLVARKTQDGTQET
jgi:Protein of unknown function (DUF4031)